MKAKKVKEEVSFDRYAALPGIEVLRVESSPRLWRWAHSDYCVCTPTRFAGRAEYVYRGATRQATVDIQPVMQPGEVHVDRRLTAPASFRVLFIAPAVLAEGAEMLGLRRVPDLSPEPVSRPRMMRAFRRLHACLEDEATDDLERQERLAGCLRLFLEAAGVLRDHRPDDRAMTRVRRIEELLRAAGGQAVTLDDLAQASGMSRFHLVREFARITGLPPHKYLMLLRVERARRLLAGGLPIRQAARRAGFVDASHLGRHFRQIAAMTPGVYAAGGAHL